MSSELLSGLSDVYVTRYNRKLMKANGLENRHYNTWSHEPDVVYWIDTDSGYPCLIMRNPGMGMLCGYVGVHKHHPLWGLDNIQCMSCQLACVDDRCLSLDLLIDVHGGITYAAPAPDVYKSAFTDDNDDDIESLLLDQEASMFLVTVTNDDWWFGFDCGHAGDLLPIIDLSSVNEESSYKTIDYVINECVLMAAQFYAIERSFDDPTIEDKYWRCGNG